MSSGVIQLESRKSYMSLIFGPSDFQYENPFGILLKKLNSCYLGFCETSQISQKLKKKESCESFIWVVQ